MRRASQPVPPLAERQKPGLSVTLPHARRLDTCQSCGQTADPSDAVALRKYREYNEYDRPTATLVILCDACSKRLIDPHHRIYAHVDWWEPIPGAMALCVGCDHQREFSCACPLLKSNGGSGMMVKFPEPLRAHFNYGGGRGEFKAIWKGAPSFCAGRTPPIETTASDENVPPNANPTAQ